MPATSVELGVHDAIYTFVLSAVSVVVYELTWPCVRASLSRMGASDDILHGRSTFMVEISETSDIMYVCRASQIRDRRRADVSWTTL